MFGPWGDIGMGALWLLCGSILFIAMGQTGTYLPVVVLASVMALVGALLLVVGIIGAGVKSGNEDSRAD